MSYRSVNGQPADGVMIDDRGLLYGDGLFETMALRNGRIRLLDRHLNRLQTGCERLALTPPPRSDLVTELARASERVRDGVLKLIVTRGSGARGYRIPSASMPTWIVSAEAAPPWPSQHAAQGVRLRLCTLRLADQPRLAGLKHLNRLEQVLARSEWQDPDIPEGLLCDTRNQLVSGTMSNLFLVTSAGVLTPGLDTCGVAGVMRGAVIEALRSQGIAVTVDAVTPATLRDAQEVFVTNALIGAWPVVGLAERHWPIGPVTRRVQDWIGNW